MLIALNKPYGVLCQFSPQAGRLTLADHIAIPEVYPAGRLDAHSEGLLLLTDDGALQPRISQPRTKLGKRYWVQVEGIPSDSALAALARGVDLGDFVSRPCEVAILEPDAPQRLWPRDPPIRYRAKIPTTWLQITLTEGKNRQIRRMSAAIGHPTLRLVRVAIGAIDLFELGLAPGQSLAIAPELALARAPIKLK